MWLRARCKEQHLGSLYSEQHTWLHSIPAGVKLLALAFLGTGLFLTDQLPVLAVATAVCVAVYASLGRASLRAKPLLIGVLVASALVASFHLFMQHPVLAGITVMRLVSTTLMGIALTLTTRYSDVLQVLEWVLSPLQRIGVKTESIALQLALMLRFTEHFFTLWRRLDDAHRLRTGKAGGFKILAPLTLQMLMAARRVADSLHLRLRR
jgi:biotin transport system permease protein